MSKREPVRAMPPGLRSHIVIAVIVTCAAVVGPTAIKAALGATTDGSKTAIAQAAPAEKRETPSTGRVTVEIRPFLTSEFRPSAYGDWDSGR